MNKIYRIIAGILFLLLSVIAITLIRIDPSTTTPSRSTEARTAGMMEGLMPGMILTQEFTAIKDYIWGVDLLFSHSGRNNTNENTLLLLDANYKSLLKTTFSSTIVKEGTLFPIRFDNSIFIGKGKRVYLCLFSNDGAQNNTISPIFNPSDSIGALYSSKVSGNDLAASIQNKVRKYHGSFMFRTYETDTSQFWLMKIFLYLLGMILSSLIIWFPWVRSTLVRIRIIPEWVFLFIAIPGAAVFTFITPPLQVPDEGNHFLRAYELSEFKFFSQEKTFPVSILMLDSAFQHLHFLAGQKTTMADITKHIGVKLEQEKKAPASPPTYTLPYLPQAMGVFIGRIIGSSPLALMYLGRLFNLLISVLIMFFAIRIIPQFKWIFLLLALMPKTLFLFGSLSYDSLTISLSFFTIAVFFYYAFSCERKINIKDLAVMALLALLLLFCKPPYFLLALLFFIIPPKKFGHLYKYIMIALGVVILGLAIWKGPAAISSFSSTDTTQQVGSADPAASAGNHSVIRPEDQIKLIKNDIPAYLKLIAKSGFDYYRSYILKSFVGVLGWIDVELPDLLTYSYLVLILLSALVLSGENVSLGMMKKLLLFLLLVGTFVIVETAMYVYATRPGRDRVFGVQGRYFIPMAPLFFMLFYNRYFNPLLNLLFSPRRKEYHKAKAKIKPVIYKEILEKEQFFDKSIYIFITCFCVFTLLYAIYVTLIRYYNI